MHTKCLQGNDELVSKLETCVSEKLLELPICHKRYFVGVDPWGNS